MLEQLNSIGIFDNNAGREYLEEQFTKAFYDTTNATIQENGRIVKEFLLMGPNGSVKVQSVWDGAKVITAALFGGKALIKGVRCLQIILGEHSIEINKHETRRQLLNALNESTSHYLLGDNSEYETEYYHIKITYPDSRISLGIVSEGHGLKPNLLLISSKQIVFLGYNREVAWFNVNEKIIKIITLDSLFSTFLHVPRFGKIIIIQETDVICINEDGEKKWDKKVDVIESYTISHNILKLKYMDDAPVEININSGESI